MSACSQEEKLAGGVGIQSFAQPRHHTGPIPANCSWLKILRFGLYAHKQSVPSRGNGHRRLSVREEPWARHSAEMTGHTRRQLLALNIAARSLADFSARPAGRRRFGRRSRVKPGVSGRNDLKRWEIAASVDLHQGLAGWLVLGDWDNHFLTIGWRMGLRRRPRPETITPRAEA